jgi:hypothetical protein
MKSLLGVDMVDFSIIMFNVNSRINHNFFGIKSFLFIIQLAYDCNRSLLLKKIGKFFWLDLPEIMLVETQRGGSRR